MFTTEVASDIDLVVFGRSYRFIKVVALVQIIRYFILRQIQGMMMITILYNCSVTTLNHDED